MESFMFFAYQQKVGLLSVFGQMGEQMDKKSQRASNTLAFM